MSLTPEETLQLINLLCKADSRTEAAGVYNVVVSPTTFMPEDFIPFKSVSVGTPSNVVGKTGDLLAPAKVP